MRCTYSVNNRTGRGDCPKTQNKISKVEAEHQSPVVLKEKVGTNMNIEAVQDTKMENDGRSETVFGQSEGDGFLMACYLLF